MSAGKLPTRRLVSQNDSAIIERAQVPRSKFLGTWTRKTAFDAGYLVPILVDEVLPGDHLSYDITAYIRMSTPLFPMFDNQRIDTFFFFVPCRLVWENWTKFMGEQATPASSIAYTVPQCLGDVSGNAIGSIYDHFGIPVQGQIDTGLIASFNALPLRAYNLIYNSWFRDQNIIDSITVETDDGPDATATYVLKKRAKSHDYFTSALPWPQKFTAPSVPIGGTAPVKGIAFANREAQTGGTDFIDVDGLITYPWYKVIDPAPSDNRTYVEFSGDGGASDVPLIYADLAATSGVAINTLRQAWLVQSLLERDARGGTRYVELIRSHFGVTNPDFRVQRPEYIGGGQSQLQLTPIAQTAPTTGVPLGALGAAATSAGSHRASYAATEHGYVIGLINVRSELSYQQGLHKLWSRSTRYDFYWPALSGLGEQAILRKEIYYVADPARDDLVFGYQERWHEYRTRMSEVTGIMRSTATGTLDAWHLSQNFVTPPALNYLFLEDVPPMGRILAAGELAEGQQYLADIMYSRTAVRPVPTFGTPAAMGRF